MSGETKAALVGAFAAVACAGISGYFTVQASRSRDDAQDSSSKQAVTAVNEGYDTTVKPFFDQTKSLTDALQTRMDVLQSEIETLRKTLSAVADHPLPPPSPTVAAAAAAQVPKRLSVPPSIRFNSEALTRFQRAPVH